jgi:hypothetical protein
MKIRRRYIGFFFLLKKNRESKEIQTCKHTEKHALLLGGGSLDLPRRLALVQLATWPSTGSYPAATLSIYTGYKLARADHQKRIT